MSRLIALILAYFFLACALIGIVLPGIPTVPFLLLSAWFAARGSDRLHNWLYSHPLLGEMLVDWEQHRAISRSHKVIAIIMMSASWYIMYLKVGYSALLVVTGLLFAVISGYLITRHEPK